MDGSTDRYSDMGCCDNFNLDYNAAKTFIKASNDGSKHVGRIWGFHGGDYEDCHLLGYKNPVRTSYETY
jgi:hypothetical protein